MDKPLALDNQRTQLKDIQLGGANALNTNRKGVERKARARNIEMEDDL